MATIEIHIATVLHSDLSNYIQSLDISARDILPLYATYDNSVPFDCGFSLILRVKRFVEDGFIVDSGVVIQ
jgi:hypothetical protein